MSDKKNEKKNEPEFTVSDRRRFYSDEPATEENYQPAEHQPAPPSSPAPAATEEKSRIVLPFEPSPTPQDAAPSRQEPAPAGPTAEQRDESNRAYKRSTEEMDAQIRRELGGQAAIDDFKVGFERIVEPLYVTALVQLGFMGQESQTQRRVDIVGARQSIDALSLLQEKTKGNLTEAEVTLLEDVLYDIRMKYLEITNALARAVQNPQEAPGGIHKA